jgi:hypothetical protein
MSGAIQFNHSSLYKFAIVLVKNLVLVGYYFKTSRGKSLRCVCLESLRFYDV